MINCPNCGASIPDTAKFCPNCGAPDVRQDECLEPEPTSDGHTQAPQDTSKKTPGVCYARLVIGIIGILIAVYLWDYASKIRTLAAVSSAFGRDVSNVSSLVTGAVVCLLGSSLAAAITWRHRTGGIWSGIVMVAAGLFTAGTFANALNQYGLLYAAFGIVLIILATKQKAAPEQSSE